MPPAATGGISMYRNFAHAVRGWDFWEDEELVSLVMKTAPASGMKNSLALVVKNGLSPMMKNALAGVTEGNSPRREPRQVGSPAGWRGGTAIASAWTHRDTDAGTTRTHKKRTGTRGTGDT